MTSLIPTCGRFLTSFRFDGLSRSIVRLSNPDVLFHRLIPRIHSYGGCTVRTIRPEKCEFFAQRYQSQAINEKMPKTLFIFS